MTTKHTPGPWVWHNEYFDDLRPLWWCEMSQGHGYISWYDPKKMKSNARLIAAAPELLAALKAMRDDEVIASVCKSPLWAKMVTAIAKAEGRND